MGGFASDRLGIGRCKGGPQMLRSPKLQKRASDPEWAQNGGFPKLPPPIFLDLGSLAHGPKFVGAKSTLPSGPLMGHLPINGFWAPEGEWVLGIGKGGCPAVCILGGGYGKAHRMHFWEGLSQKKRVALRAPPT